MPGRPQSLQEELGLGGCGQSRLPAQLRRATTGTSMPCRLGWGQTDTVSQHSGCKEPATARMAMEPMTESSFCGAWPLAAASSSLLQTLARALLGCCNNNTAHPGCSGRLQDEDACRQGCPALWEPLIPRPCWAWSHRAPGPPSVSLGPSG